MMRTPLGRLLLGTLATVCAVGLCRHATADAPPADAIGPALQQSMIWLDALPVDREVYVAFRKPFQLDRVPQQAILHLFADSRYILWINGRYVERGPCRFDPIQPQYDTLDVRRYLRSGPNVLAVLVHHDHDGKKPEEPGDFSGRIMRHVPGLTARLELADAADRQVIATDATWRGNAHTRYLPSGPSWASIPDRIDARRDDGDWTLPEYNDSAWPKTVRIDGRQWGPLRRRQIPLLRETEVGPLTAIQCTLAETTPKLPAPLSKLCPVSLSAGQELVLDAGRFFQAYALLDFDADEGTELELKCPQAWHVVGDSSADLSGINRYVLVNHYTARSGRQQYMSGDTFGGKYVVLSVRKGQIRLHDLKLIDRLYPYDVVGRFHSSDDKLNAIWQAGVDTIRICSEDAYVDCAVRERVEWLADAVMVAHPVTRATMVGPSDDGRPYYGDPRLLRNLLRHIGQSQQSDGRVKAHHPSNRWDIHGFIDDYACLWIQAIRTNYDHTGDLALARELWPAVTAQLQWFLDRRTERGLVRGREFVYFGNPLAYQVCEGATLNAYVVGALRDAAEIARLLEHPADQARYAQAADALQAAINDQLWDETAGAYCGAIQDGKRTALTLHAGMLCLYYDVVPEARRQRVEQWVLQNFDKEGAMPYQYAFFFNVLYRINTDAADRLVLDTIRRRWSPMADFQTKTTWEGFSPGEVCHEAGAVPTIFLSSYLLGVRVDGPIARRRLLIEPRLAGLPSAEGVVATEFGPVPVSWKSDPQGLSFDVEIPADVAASVCVPRRAQPASLVVDGQPAAPSDRSTETAASRYLRVELLPGRHHGELREGTP